MASTHVGSYAASSKEDGFVMIHLLIRAMYPVKRSGDYLCVRYDVGTPTFCAASSFNLSASMVHFLPVLMFGLHELTPPLHESPPVANPHLEAHFWEQEVPPLHASVAPSQSTTSWLSPH